MWITCQIHWQVEFIYCKWLPNQQPESTTPASSIPVLGERRRDLNIYGRWRWGRFPLQHKHRGAIWLQLPSCCHLAHTEVPRVAMANREAPKHVWIFHVSSARTSCLTTKWLHTVCKLANSKAQSLSLKCWGFFLSFIGMVGVPQSLMQRKVYSTASAKRRCRLNSGNKSKQLGCHPVLSNMVGGDQFSL